MVSERLCFGSDFWNYRSRTNGSVGRYLIKRLAFRYCVSGFNVFMLIVVFLVGALCCQFMFYDS